MTSRSNYRVKVDLSRYHQDARRFSWIYVDCANILFISHVKQHIAFIFGIQEPFYLLLNGKEYLPPSEDVRVLKENELIAVVPGSGISHTTPSTMALSSPGIQHAIIEHTVQSMDISNTDYRNEKSKMHTDVKQNDSNTLNNSLADVSAIDATMYHSIREVTEKEGTSDSKATDDNITDNCSTIDPYGAPVHKRKRIRRKRSKNVADASLIEKMNHEPQTAYHKTKILNLPVLPTGKHLHFDNVDDKIPTVVENDMKDPAAENKKRKPIVQSLPPFKNSRVANLSTLLALRQCSTPLMFVNKKAKHVSENDFEASTKNNFKMESFNAPKDVQTTQHRQSNGNNDAAETTEEPSDYSQLNPEKYPSLESVTELNDIIAFKILRIGHEYTPEVSDYIVARTISWCPKKLLFTFQILRGQMQIQTPLGKFSLPEDESEDQICDTVNVNFSQLIDPRLIYRK